MPWGHHQVERAHSLEDIYFSRPQPAATRKRVEFDMTGLEQSHTIEKTTSFTQKTSNENYFWLVAAILEVGRDPSGPIADWESRVFRRLTIYMVPMIMVDVNDFRVFL